MKPDNPEGIEVWLDAPEIEKEKVKIGTLWIETVRNQEVFSFEYDKNWLSSPSAFSIDIGLALYPGKQYASAGKGFGVFSDSAPDRWGRTLMKRREAAEARKEKRKPRRLLEKDYLLGVDDFLRMGALRFSADHGQTFLENDEDHSIPPLTKLRELEEISRGYELGENEDWIRQLIKPGSSLGGARPKSNVIDSDGSLWIAKFPSKYDETDIGAWEKVVHDLARLSGLTVPESRVIKLSEYGSTFLVKRFDREDGNRLFFSSAMSLLGAEDGESSSKSYLELADFIRSFGSNPERDLKELFRRVAFNMAVSNADDHLRNHGFILGRRGWRLSPVYDVNPDPFGEALSLGVSFEDSTISKSNLLEFGTFLDLDPDWMERTLYGISDSVKENWRVLARKYQISSAEISEMEPAFSQDWLNS